MDLKLINTEFEFDGIFGKIVDDKGDFLFCTLQHAFPTDSGTYLPKIPPGTYTCVRGEHRLEHMNHTFITFEITGVTGHTNILFHIGNYNKDSDGCILLGLDIVGSNGAKMVISSSVAFNEFMELQKNVDKFNLTVE